MEVGSSSLESQPSSPRGQWRGDPLVASMVRSQELSRTGNEKLFESADSLFESADSLVLDADAHDGPMVQLSPHGCTFAGEPVRMTFAIDRLVEGHLGDAFIVVLRKRSGGPGQSALNVAKEFAEEKQRRGDGSDESDASEVVAVLERWASMNEPGVEPEMETKPSQLPAEEEVDTHEERGDTALAPTNS
eukprot:COSAG02_NODE_3721_length_6323_cov_3.825353_1_plen_190_part_00